MRLVLVAMFGIFALSGCATVETNERATEASKVERLPLVRSERMRDR